MTVTGTTADEKTAPPGNETGVVNTAMPRGFIGRGSFTTLSGQGGKIFLQLVSTAVLGRLLMPEDFGMMGTVWPLLTFFTIFRDLGLSNVSIQRKEISEQEVSNLFWVNVAAGLILTVIVAAMAPAAALFYRDHRLVAVVSLLSLIFLINGISAQYLAMMQRNFRVGRLVAIDVISTAAGTATSICGAWFGMGYWALAIAPVVIQSLSLILSAASSRWQPKWPRWDRHMAGMVNSGAGFAGFNLFNYLSRNLDQIIIGRVLGEKILGYYSRAYNLMLVPLSQVTGPLAQVMIPALSRLNGDPKAYRAAYIGALEKVTFFCCPLVMANIVGADWTVGILLGPKWVPSVQIYLLLAISALVQPVGNSTGWLFISQGRSRDMFLWGVFSSVIVVTSFLIGLKWGVLGIAGSYTIGQILVITPTLWYWVGRRGPVRARDLAIATIPLLIISSLLGAAFYALRQVWSPPPVVGLAAALIWLFGAQTAVLILHPHTRRVVQEILSPVPKILAKLKGQSAAKAPEPLP